MNDRNFEELQKNFISAQKKLEKGATIQDLTQDEIKAVQYARQQQEDQEQKHLQNLSEHEKERFKFHKNTASFAQSGGKRIIHISDTHSNPDDLEKIINMNLQEAGGLGENDILVHTGDLLNDFIDFKLSNGLQGFRGKRIIQEGRLGNKASDEFLNAYEYILEKHGISDMQLIEGQPTEQLMQGLQGVYFGIKPHFLTREEISKYEEQYDLFKKHLTTAIQNNAQEQYDEYKKVFEKKGLNPDNLILLPGNHDVPSVMEDVFKDYMAPVGKVFEKKGVKFASPLSGSTGAHLGEDFDDVFGYTDYKEKLEKVKRHTPAFQELLKYLSDCGVNFIDEKHLSHLISMSQQRLSQGISKGGLVQYFESRIKPQFDNSVSEKIGQVVTKVPDNVDFYLFHGMPNHPSYSGIEENAAYKQIDKKGGAILHGHIHGKTTHRMGKSMLLNQGHGTQNYGIYHLNQKNKIEDILSRTMNETLGVPEYEIVKPEQLKIQNNKKEYK